MVFSSMIFLFAFLPALLVCYFLLPRRLRAARNVLLLVFSLVFYAWGGPKLLPLMLVSITANYCGGLLCAPGRPHRKLAAAAVVAVNLALLGYFKYTNFFFENLQLLGLNVTVPNITLPIGISFFTFQGMSYVLDVYRGDARTERNPLRVALYVALFPQLVAGPIVRYTTVAGEIRSRNESISEAGLGAMRFCFGLAKKMLLANALGQVADAAFSAGSLLTTSMAWLGALAYTGQIYFDFSGYSDMAIGLGRVFGFHFLENFNYPYVSRSVTEFWRRWHISLGNFFREYVYIPLGGNRRGLLKQARNILIVWMLTGFWHGAAVNFIVWGLYFAVFLLLEKMFLLRLLEKLPRAVSHIYALLFIVFGWVIFSFDDFSRGFTFLRAMLGLTGAGLSNNASVYLLYTNALLLVVLAVGSPQLPARAAKAFERRLQNRQVLLAVVQNAVYLLLLTGSLACVVSSSYNPFLYFRF